MFRRLGKQAWKTRRTKKGLAAGIAIQITERNPPSVDGDPVACDDAGPGPQVPSMASLQPQPLETDVAIPTASLDSPPFCFLAFQAQAVSLVGQTQVCLCLHCKGCWESNPWLGFHNGKKLCFPPRCPHGKFPHGAGRCGCWAAPERYESPAHPAQTYTHT